MKGLERSIQRNFYAYAWKFRKRWPDGMCSVRRVAERRTYQLVSRQRSDERSGFGHFDHVSAGDFVVPGLLLSVPAGPEKAESEGDCGKDAG